MSEAAQAVSAALASKEQPSVQSSPESSEVPPQADPKVSAEAGDKGAEEKDPQFATKFAALSRREKALRERERAIKAQMEEIERTRGEASKQQDEYRSKYEQLVQKLANKPTEAYKEIGKSWDEVVEAALNENSPTVEYQVKKMQEQFHQEIEALKQELSKRDQLLKEQEEAKAQKETEMVIDRTKKEIRHLINSSDTYEFLKDEGDDAVDIAFEAIRTHFEESGEVLDLDEVLQNLEAQLEEQFTKRLSLKKAQSKLGSKPAEANKPQEAAPTLSNDLSTQSPVQSLAAMSEDERKKEAAKLLRWSR